MMRFMRLFCILWIVSQVVVPVVSAEPQPQLAPLSSAFQSYRATTLLPKSSAKVLAAPGVADTKSTGYVPSPNDYSHLKGKSSQISQQISSIKRDYAPLQYDLRALGRVTPVRDQGSCGDCWTFAALASTESALLPGETTDFSENNLKNTSGFDFGVCEGGNGDMARAYLSRWSGPVAETDDPYSEVSAVSPTGLLPKKHIQEVLIIPGRGSSLDNDGIKQALIDYGAVSTSIYIDGGATTSSLSSYYKPANSSYYYNGASGSNHIVAIVGWDDTYSATKFATTPPGNGAFIVKNSWGTNWGNSGYFYISYYDTVVGGDNYLFTSATDPALYTQIYQYDPQGPTSTMGYGQTAGWFANIFTAGQAENLAAIAFNTNDINSAYQVFISTGVSAAAPRSGSQAATFTGTIPTPGYHTLKVPTPVALRAGERFSVVVKVTNSTNIYPIPLEGPVAGYSSHATASAGQSFVSSAGTTWKDVITAYPDTNVTLKAFSTIAPQTWTVTATTDGNGSVTCTSPVTNAASSRCIVSPTSGYQVATFTDNSVDMKSSVTGSNYSIATVTSNHTIAATFSLIPPAPINGVCGSSNGGSFTVAPTSNICATGTASLITGTGPWSWICSGIFGGRDMHCTASVGTAPASPFPPAPVPQTGQTTCYDATGTVITCSGSGQDGEFKNGWPWPSPRFVDNGDQTQTDKLTGLIWSKNANPAGATKTWQEALDYIKTLNSSNYMGYNDWRLPNINELKSLVNQGALSPATWLSGQGFSSVQSTNYWSSTSVANSTSGAWYVDVNYGTVGYSIKFYSSSVWPVRSGHSGAFGSLMLPKTGQTACYDAAGSTVSCSGTGQDGEVQSGAVWPSPRVLDNGDQIQADTLTGLIWSKSANPAAAPKTWQGALDYIKTLNSSNYLGYNDWRLPNRNELDSLIHRGESNAATWLNGQGFSSVQSDGYWSSTSGANGTYSAWHVSMSSGTVDNYNYKYGLYSVWPVRSGQYWAFDTLILSAAPRFGTVQTDTIAPAHEISVGNRGGSALSITSIIISGTHAAEFSISTGGSNPCRSLSPALAAGASCTLMLGFAPVNKGAMVASLDITANGTTNSIPLSGTVITTINGVVTDQATGLPVSGATVTLNTTATATTDTDGSYTFGDLPAATYSITVSKTGYQTISRSVVVTTTASAKADVLLPTVGTLNITTTKLPWASPNVPYSSRVMVAGGTAPYTFSKPTGTLPVGLTLDTTTGIISGTATGSGSYTFAIGVTDTVRGYAEKEFTIELISPLQITAATLPSGQQGIAYSSSITATGGKTAYSFSVASGSLSSGLTLATSGALSGTPRESGTFTFTAKLTDATGAAVSQIYTLVLTAAAALTLNTTTLLEGSLGINYTATVSASGGVPPRTFSVSATLPPGLSLNSATGVISGIPTTAGLTNVTFSVSDYSYPTAQTTSVTLPLRIWNTPSKPGDCDSSGTVTIAEVQSAINMFLGLKTVAACVDQDSSGGVSIAEVQKTINSFLGL